MERAWVKTAKSYLLGERGLFVCDAVTIPAMMSAVMVTVQICLGFIDYFHSIRCGTNATIAYANPTGFAGNFTRYQFDENGNAYVQNQPALLRYWNQTPTPKDPANGNTAVVPVNNFRIRKTFNTIGVNEAARYFRATFPIALDTNGTPIGTRGYAISAGNSGTDAVMIAVMVYNNFTGAILTTFRSRLWGTTANDAAFNVQETSLSWDAGDYSASLSGPLTSGSGTIGGGVSIP